jgi:hypothetical protein
VQVDSFDPRYNYYAIICKELLASRSQRSARTDRTALTFIWENLCRGDEGDELNDAPCAATQRHSDSFNPEAIGQNAGTYNDRGIAKQNKGVLIGAMAVTPNARTRPNICRAFLPLLVPFAVTFLCRVGTMESYETPSKYA